jgi:peptide/nickel transport system substrate-binding protein
VGRAPARLVRPLVGHAAGRRPPRVLRPHDGAFRAGPQDAEFDRLFGTLARETDPQDARRLAEEIDRYCFEQSKALFLCAPQALYAVNRHVEFKAYRATFELADTEVDPAHWSRRDEE